MTHLLFAELSVFNKSSAAPEVGRSVFGLRLPHPQTTPTVPFSCLSPRLLAALAIFDPFPSPLLCHNHALSRCS